jgi:hypothetical protein
LIKFSSNFLDGTKQSDLIKQPGQVAFITVAASLILVTLSFIAPGNHVRSFLLKDLIMSFVVFVGMPTAFIFRNKNMSQFILNNYFQKPQSLAKNTKSFFINLKKKFNRNRTDVVSQA